MEGRKNYIQKQSAFAVCSIGMTLGVVRRCCVCVCVDESTTGKQWSWSQCGHGIWGGKDKCKGPGAGIHLASEGTCGVSSNGEEFIK